MIPRPRILVCLLSCFLAQTAMATYLRLIPSNKIQVNQQSKNVRFEWTLLNDGDEAAEAVGLELPALNQAYILASELAPQGKASQTLTVPFSKLGIDKPGVYSVVYRVSYKDANLFPFSAPHLVQIVIPPGVGRVLVMQLNRPGAEIQLPLQSTRKVHFKLQNVAGKPLILEKIEPLSPVEIETRLQDLAIPYQMPAGEEKALVVSLSPSQALIGSVYVLGLVVSGTVEGMHFSEPMTFVIRIRENLWSPRNILLGVIIGISLILFVVQLAKKRLLRRAQPAVVTAPRKPKTK